MLQAHANQPQRQTPLVQKKGESESEKSERVRSGPPARLLLVLFQGQLPEPP